MHVIRRYSDVTDEPEYWDGEKFIPKSGEALRFYQRWDAEAEISKLQAEYGELEAIDAFKSCPECRSINIRVYRDRTLEYDGDYRCWDCGHVFP